MEFNKLVRDRIPELIKAQGRNALTRILPDGEYVSSLEEKLDEEVREYHESKEIEELADILEVVYALCQARGATLDELMAAYRKKHEARGGFSQRIFLISASGD